MRKNSPSQEHFRTAAIVILLLCFLSATACLSLCTGGIHLCVHAAKGGSAALVAAKENMRTGEWVAVVAIVTVGAIAFLALILFMLVFPIVNRIAKTHIPCLDIFSSEEKPSKKSDTRTRKTKATEKSAEQTDDRYVKTVRIDTLYNPTQEKELTASAIDKAVRQAVQKDNGKKKKQ